jgi:hypothetical protein
VANDPKKSKLSKRGCIMLKKTGLELVGLVAMVFILFVAQGQTEEQGWKKTITLPSGEVVCDLNGKWDLEFTPRGELKMMIGNRITDLLNISQEGNTYKGVRLIGNQWNPKGQVVIEGELDKNGIKTLTYNANGLEGQFKANLSKDGNMIEFRGVDFFMELTRK